MALSAVDVDFINDQISRDYFLASILSLSVSGGSLAVSSPASGFFVGPLNCDKAVAHILKEEYPGVPELGSCYFVDDSPEDVVARLTPLLEKSSECYAVFITPILRSEQPDRGGWRWNKWGEYVGKHETTTEYLYDEPDIESVVVVHIVQTHY